MIIFLRIYFSNNILYLYVTLFHRTKRSIIWQQFIIVKIPLTINIKICLVITHQIEWVIITHISEDSDHSSKHQCYHLCNSSSHPSGDFHLKTINSNEWSHLNDNQHIILRVHGDAHKYSRQQAESTLTKHCLIQ